MGSKLREIGAVSHEASQAYANGCTGKVAFDTFALAHEVAERRGLRFPHKLHRYVNEAYRCGHCGAFHIGSPVHRPDERKLA